MALRIDILALPEIAAISPVNVAERWLGLLAAMHCSSFAEAISASARASGTIDCPDTLGACTANSSAAATSRPARRDRDPGPDLLALQLALLIALPLTPSVPALLRILAPGPLSAPRAPGRAVRPRPRAWSDDRPSR